MLTVSGYYVGFMAVLVAILPLAANERTRMVGAWLAGGLCLAFMALRYDAGYDYFSYRQMATWQVDLSFLEPAPAALARMARAWGEPQLFFIITAILYVSCFVSALVMSRRNLAWCLLFFVCLPLIYLSAFGFVKQHVAIALFMLAMACLERGMRLPALVLMLVGTSFHYTLALYLPLLVIYPLLRRAYPFWLYLGLLPLCFVAGPLAKSILSALGLYAHYFEDFSGGGEKLYVIYLLICLGTLVLWKHFRLSLDPWAFNLMFIGVALYTLFITYGEHVARASYYFLPFAIFVICDVIEHFRDKLLPSLISGVLMMALFFMSLKVAAGNQDHDFLNNYEFYFLSDEALVVGNGGQS